MRGRRAHGERRVLRTRAITVCPLCRGDLATNVHPLEKRLDLLIFTPFAVGLIVLLSVPALSRIWMIAVGGALLLMIAACGHLHLKTRSWQRFRSYEGKDGGE